MEFDPEFTVRGFFRPPSDSDFLSTFDLHVNWKQCRRVFRRTNHGILLPTEDEPIGPSHSSRFRFSCQRLTEIGSHIWTSIRSLDFPIAFANSLCRRITSYAFDSVPESLTGLVASLFLVADINFVQRIYVDCAPRPLEFIQTRQAAAASALADENLILGTTTDSSEVDSIDFVIETFILRRPTEGWGDVEGDSDIFSEENSILEMPAEVDDDKNAGIEMLERIKSGNWAIGGGEEVTCSVCMEVFSEGQEVMTMACKHTYHELCILTWLNRNQTCPLCRRPI